MRTQDKQLSYGQNLWVWPPLADWATGPKNLPNWILYLLEKRGIQSEKEIADYLSPSLKDLPDPVLMADMDTASQRVADAVIKSEKITIYGDYDVDGVSSSALLTEFLREVGAKVDFYIPDRLTEGYGLNLGAIETIARNSRLLITTDLGITAVEEVNKANELGLDVVIVDHHQVPEELPKAVACLDPHRPDCKFPFEGLCATGVAFMLAIGVRRELRARGHFKNGIEPTLKSPLDLVALATVADMVPVKSTNRLLVRAGLQRLATQARPGLSALMQIAKIDPQWVTTGDLGYKIGPRINARGRLEHAGLAVELLLSKDPKQCQSIASSLDAANQERQRIEKQSVEEAIQFVEANNYERFSAFVIYQAEWHPGVLGLIASRLAHRYNRPTFIIGEGGKASGRSIPGVNLHAALEKSAELFIRFGGHKAAAGLTIVEENIEDFRQRFDRFVRDALGPPPYQKTLEPDLELPEEMISLGFLSELESLAPFGMENPEPLFVSKGLRVVSKKLVGKDHLKLVLGEQRLSAIAFGKGDLIDELPEQIDVAYRLERNIFRGQTSLQLRIEDLRVD